MAQGVVCPKCGHVYCRVVNVKEGDTLISPGDPQGTHINCTRRLRVCQHFKCHHHFTTIELDEHTLHVRLKIK